MSEINEIRSLVYNLRINKNKAQFNDIVHDLDQSERRLLRKVINGEQKNDTPAITKLSTRLRTISEGSPLNRNHKPVIHALKNLFTSRISSRKIRSEAKTLPKPADPPIGKIRDEKSLRDEKSFRDEKSLKDVSSESVKAPKKMETPEELESHLLQDFSKHNAQLSSTLNKLKEGKPITPMQTTELYSHLVPYLQSNPKMQPVWEAFYRKTLGNPDGPKLKFMMDEKEGIELPFTLLKAQSPTFSNMAGEGDLEFDKTEPIPLPLSVLGVDLTVENKKQFGECLQSGLLGKPNLITHENALLYLGLADRLDVVWLKQACQEFIEKNFHAQALKTYSEVSPLVSEIGPVNPESSLESWLLDVCGLQAAKVAIQDKNELDEFLSFLEAWSASPGHHPEFLLHHFVEAVKSAEPSEKILILKHLDRIKKIETKITGATSGTNQIIEALNEMPIEDRKIALKVLENVNPETNGRLYQHAVDYFFDAKVYFRANIDDAVKITTKRGFLDLALISDPSLEIRRANLMGQNCFNLDYSGSSEVKKPSCIAFNSHMDRLKKEHLGGKFFCPYSLLIQTHGVEEGLEKQVLEKLLKHDIFTVVQAYEPTKYEGSLLVNSLISPKSPVQFLGIWGISIENTRELFESVGSSQLKGLFIGGNIHLPKDLANVFADALVKTQNLETINAKNFQFESEEDLNHFAEAVSKNTSLKSIKVGLYIDDTDEDWDAVQVATKSIEKARPDLKTEFPYLKA